MVALLSALYGALAVTVLLVAGHRLADASAHVADLTPDCHPRPASAQDGGNCIADRDIPQVADVQGLGRVRIAEVDDDLPARVEILGSYRLLVARLEHLAELDHALVRQPDADPLAG